MKKIKILAIAGSIRAQSSSHAILEEIATLIPSYVELELFDGLATIPAYDGREKEPEAVLDFKNKIKNADGVVICTPEYAFGVPGALKNALDWTVGTGEFVDKPVAHITASSVGDKGHASLQQTLTAISASLHPETNLLIPSIRAKVKDGKVTDVETKNLIVALTKAFVAIVNKKGVLQ